jgi:uncharacterized protein
LKNLLKNFSSGDLRILNEELKDFLPEEIIDSHVHLWREDSFKKEISEKRRNQNPALDPDIIDGFTYEDFKNVSEKIFPEKKCRGLFFGMPVKEADLDKMNNYVSDVYAQSGNYGLFNPEPDLEEIPKDFFKNGFIGFKPYVDLVDFKAPKDFSKLDIDISMFDFISKKVLEFSNEYGLILLIHIPRAGRLNDKRNIEEIKAISKKYPDIKIVLAHAGRSYCYSDIKDSVEYLKDIKNLYVDTAMINSFSVMKVLMEEMRPEKILYGSDLPIAIFKGKNIDINNKHYFITSTPKVWSLSSSVMNLDSFTFFIYEIVRAIRVAAKSINLNKESIKNIFYSNCNNMIENIVNKVM